MNNYYYSESSKAKLATCHPKLQELFNEVIKYLDLKITFGYRNEEQQNKCFREGTSKKKYGFSKHNYKKDDKPYSLAADAIMCPISWVDIKTHYYVMGYILGIASQLGIKIRSGGDWDMDNNLHNQTFFDLFHFELIEE